MSAGVDGELTLVPWRAGDEGRPSRPTGSMKAVGGLVVTLDCGHRFKVPPGSLEDGWGERTVSCPLPHATTQRFGGEIREVAQHVLDAELALERAKRVASGDAGARLVMDVEQLLQEVLEGTTHDQPVDEAAWRTVWRPRFVELAKRLTDAAGS